MVRKRLDKSNHVKEYNIEQHGSTEEHQKLVDDILFAFGSRPDVRVWIRPVGFDSHRKIRYGVPGETDVDGIVAPWGRRLAIEIKTGEADLSPEQVKWRDNCIHKFGGIYIIARSVEQALADFEKQNRPLLLDWDKGIGIDDLRNSHLYIDRKGTLV